MTTLEELLGQENDLKNAKVRLFSEMQAVDDSLASVRIRITETRNVNRNALTYNLPNETLAAIPKSYASNASVGDPKATTQTIRTPHIFHITPMAKYRLAHTTVVDEPRHQYLTVDRGLASSVPP
jgi:hypothetical protein